MKIRIRLIPRQWKLLTSVFSNIGQAVLLFAAAAFFVPDTVALKYNYPKANALVFVLVGLLLILVAVIISKKEQE